MDWEIHDYEKRLFHGSSPKMSKYWDILTGYTKAYEVDEDEYAEVLNANYVGTLRLVQVNATFGDVKEG